MMHCKALSFSSSSNNSALKELSTLETAMYCIIGSFFVSTAATLKYIYDQVGNLEGLQRSFSFYKVAIPLYVRYRYLQVSKAPDEDWDELDVYASKVGLEKTLEMKGFYIKSGQMAAANIGNAFPKIWQDTMSVLQDECPSKSFSEVKDIVDNDYAELGLNLDDVFEYFDPIPIGAASIGQVHRAKLKKTGEEVVVKIQYPEVERLFRGDVRTMIMFCKVAQPVHVPALEEIEHQFMTEFDYKKEALQLQTVHDNMEKADLLPSVCKIPVAYIDFCTKNVLVMSYIDGEKMVPSLMGDMERHAIRLGKSVEEFRNEEAAKDKEARLKKIERKGPTSSEYDKYISILNFQRHQQNAKAALFNNTIGWVPGIKPMDYVSKSTLPINHAKLVDTLIHIHGHQVLVDGYFNGDPHPGNILLLNNNYEDNKLGLIDYGQVKKLSEEQRILMCKMIIALADEDKNEVVRLMRETGYRSRNMDPEVMYTFCKVSFDEDNMKITDGMHIQEFLEYLEKSDPVENVGRDFIMVSRVTILLRGLAHSLKQSRSIAKLWKPIAEEQLKLIQNC